MKIFCNTAAQGDVYILFGLACWAAGVWFGLAMGPWVEAALAAVRGKRCNIPLSQRYRQLTRK